MNKHLAKVILIICLIVKSPDVSSDISLYAYNDVIIPNNINNYMLVNIFTRKTLYWQNGQKIVVFVKKMTSFEHKAFVSSVLGMSSFKFDTLLERSTYAGEAESVIELATDLEMIVNISKTPYSIGYTNYGIVVNLKDMGIKKIYETN